VSDGKIYLLATNTKKPISKLITAYTGEIFNHASIAFDKNLIECYSFSMGRNGFVRESPEEWPAWTEFEMWSVKASASTIATAKRYIHEQAHSGKTFSYGGIAGIVIGRPIEDREAMFCSEFVERTCIAAGMKPSAANPALTTPTGVVRRTGAEKVTSGHLMQYIMARFSARQNLVVESDLGLF
jgi:hypothetical protein